MLTIPSLENIRPNAFIIPGQGNMPAGEYKFIIGAIGYEGESIKWRRKWIKSYDSGYYTLPTCSKESNWVTIKDNDLAQVYINGVPTSTIGYIVFCRRKLERGYKIVKIVEPSTFPWLTDRTIDISAGPLRTATTFTKEELYGKVPNYTLGSRVAMLYSPKRATGVIRRR
jgi:hypothetical protein